ncbi:uncharacterized protein LOC119431437 [Dermacentor silvarum]|uniref:uncharacterized protein LOC119431437 n=1 Tax=Dermacentor silvarum TaxID=543639 RepID=UPI002101AEF1|nr:uncharacterized protein LOC119431437 [Dermacentor silvarum]
MMATNTSPMSADNGTQQRPQSTVSNENHSLAIDMEAVSNVRLPPFWPKNPAVWFTQVEALFDLRRITAQRAKYLHVVSTLPSEVADEFDDVLSLPHATRPYDHFKTIVLTRKALSERSRLQQLLNTEELGDRRPSQLLHRMRQLLGDSMQDSESPLLRESFLQRLPQNLLPVLAAAGDMPLEKLAELADRVAEYSRAGPCTVAAATGVTPDTQARHSRLERLEEKIEQLAASIAAMWTSTDGRSHGNSRSRSRYRTRSNCAGYCWYHVRFGARANKCREPCRWQENTNASR